MRLLIVVETWGLIGGTERYATAIAPALAARGHDVSLLCAEDRSAAPTGLPLTVLEQLGESGLSGAGRGALQRVLRELAPDVLFLLTARNADALEALLDAGPVVRYVQDHTLFCPGLNKVHEDGSLCTRPLGVHCLQRYWLQDGCIGYKPSIHRNRLVSPLVKLRAKLREIDLHRGARTLLVNSEYMRGELLQAGLPPANLHTLPYFTGAATPDQPAEPLPGKTAEFVARGAGPLLVTPARLTLPDKGVDYLLTALGKLDFPFRTVVAGSGPAEDWLREKAREEGLGERVHFAGWLPAGPIETLLAAADLVICPSMWNEPFGLVGIEAMAHARPVVAFDVGGIGEWLHDGETGRLVPRGDCDALAGAITELACDPDRAREMGAAGERRVEAEFRAGLHLERLEGHLQRAAGGGAA